MLFLGIAGVLKIYKGSKIPFAYTMTASTCSYGVTFVVLGVLPFSSMTRSKIMITE